MGVTFYGVGVVYMMRLAELSSADIYTEGRCSTDSQAR